MLDALFVRTPFLSENCTRTYIVSTEYGVLTDKWMPGDNT